MKKILLATCAVILVHTCIYSQFKIGFYGNLNIYPSTGPDRVFVGKNGSSFDRFVASYNALNSGSMSSPLSNLKMKVSPNFGLNFMAGVFYSEVGYRSLRGKSEGTFMNGNKRVIEMTCNDLDVGIGFGKGGDKFYAYLVGFLNFGFGDKLESYTVYPNGIESYGTENFLNGRYKSTRLTARGGLRFGYKVKNNLWLTLWIDRVKEGKKEEYADNLAGDIETEVVGVDNQFIGEDWGAYLADEATYILEDRPLLQSGWNGMQVQLGVNFLLGDNE